MSFSRRTKTAILQATVLAAAAFAPRAHAQASEVWMKLFDGADLKGWQCRTQNWKVDPVAGSVTGSGAISFNTFMISDSSYSDFHFKVDARLPGSGGYRNSGVVYRGKISNPTNFEVGGYQVDISDNYWGSFYHEQGNELPWTPVSNCSPAAKTDWATLEIIANKDKVTHLVNGKTCWEHSGFKVTAKGIIALQLHNPGDFSVDFKNVFIQPLNGTFTIPPDKAYDKDGKPVSIVGKNLAPKNGRAARSNGAFSFAGIPGAVYDVEGRVVSFPAASADGNTEVTHAGKRNTAAYGKYFQAR